MIRLLLWCAGVAGLVGCASAPTASMPRGEDNVDTAQVAAIERAAMAQGVRVIWVNKPQRRTAGG
jgi:hypothetical protein